MAPVGCAVVPPISGLLQIEGIPVEGLGTWGDVTCWYVGRCYITSVASASGSDDPANTS